MANTVYIAHFYPPEDAAAFFEPGAIIEVMGEVFGSYADAANQLAEELGDIMEADLPVGAYIIEAIDLPAGYEVVDCFDLDEQTGAGSRASNPATTKAPPRTEPSATDERDAERRVKERLEKRNAPKTSTKEPKAIKEPKAPSAPKPPKEPKIGDKRATRPVSERERVGEQIGKTSKAWLAELKGIDRGEEEEVYEANAAASKYGEFVARYAPFPASARNISGEIMRAIEGPERVQQKQVLAQARERGKAEAAPAIVADISRGPTQIAESLAELQVTVAQDRDDLKQAIKNNDTAAAAEAERNIAFGETRAQMLNLLQNFCPYYAHTEEGKKAVKAVKGKELTEEMARDLVGYSLIEEIKKREAALKTKVAAEKKALAETERKEKAAKAAEEKAAKQPTATNKKKAKKAEGEADAAAAAAAAATAAADAAEQKLAQAKTKAASKPRSSGKKPK